jgi:hypothetical protein
LPHQAFHDLGLLCVCDLIVGKPREQRIDSVQVGTGEREEKSAASRRAVEQPGTTDIGIQADSDLRHGHARVLGHHAMASTRHQAQATSHHDPVPPAQHRLRISMNQVVEPVFPAEERERVGIAANVVSLR